MDLDVDPSWYVPLPAEAGNASAIEKAVANLIGDLSPSHPSASHAVKRPRPCKERCQQSLRSWPRSSIVCCSESCSCCPVGCHGYGAF